MKTIIISPHTDDAIFSLGSYISGLDDCTILTPFAGIPKDPAGEKKHTTLRQEHERACHYLGVKYINGDFLDDVYPERDLSGLQDWIIDNTEGYDFILVPLGIHQPDHILVRDICNAGLHNTLYYAELPYRILYPLLAKRARELYAPKRILTTYPGTSSKKMHAVEQYASQLRGWDYPSQLFATEHIW